MLTLKQKAEAKHRTVKRIMNKSSSHSSLSTVSEDIIMKIKVLDFTVIQIKHICKNTKTRNMVCKVLNEDPKKLKKLCKYVDVYIANMEKSPESIKKEIKKVKDKTKIKDLPSDLVDKIVDMYSDMIPKKMVLRDWITKSKLKNLESNPNAIDYIKENIEENDIHWLALSGNPNAVELIKENEHMLNEDKAVISLASNRNPEVIKLAMSKINAINNDTYYRERFWYILSSNPNAIDILKQNIDNIDWMALSSNPNGIDLLKQNQSKIDWSYLSGNPNAIKLLKIHHDKIDWKFLSKNPNAIKLLEKNKDKINWRMLSENPNAIKLLEENKSKIVWRYLSRNPGAIKLLEENKDKIDWEMLSANPNAMKLLEENKDKIDWFNISNNPSIFIKK